VFRYTVEVFRDEKEFYMPIFLMPKGNRYSSPLLRFDIFYFERDVNRHIYMKIQFPLFWGGILLFFNNFFHLNNKLL